MIDVDNLDIGDRVKFRYNGIRIGEVTNINTDDFGPDVLIKHNSGDTSSSVFVDAGKVVEVVESPQ